MNSYGNLLESGGLADTVFYRQLLMLPVVLMLSRSAVRWRKQILKRADLSGILQRNARLRNPAERQVIGAKASRFMARFAGYIPVVWWKLARGSIRTFAFEWWLIRFLKHLDGICYRQSRILSAIDILYEQRTIRRLVNYAAWTLRIRQHTKVSISIPSHCSDKEFTSSSWWPGEESQNYRRSYYTPPG